MEEEMDLPEGSSQNQRDTATSLNTEEAMDLGEGSSQEKRDTAASSLNMEESMDSQEHSSQDNPETEPHESLEGWTKKEKYYLLMGLKSYGSKDLQTLQLTVPSKSVDDIKIAIDFYMKQAKIKVSTNDDNTNSKNNRKNKKASQAPLAYWADYVSNKYSLDELNTEISTAFRMIADLEDIPPTMSTENIDFKELYLLVANALDGKSLPDNDQLKNIIQRCIIDTAMESKSFIKPYFLKKVMSSIQNNSEEFKFNTLSVGIEHNTVLHLSSQTSYNPLHIPDHCLKYAESQNS